VEIDSTSVRGTSCDDEGFMVLLNSTLFTHTGRRNEEFVWDGRCWSVRTATELPPSRKSSSRVFQQISAGKPARGTYTHLNRYMKDRYYISWRTSTLTFCHFGINKYVRPGLKPSRRRKRGLRIWTCGFRCHLFPLERPKLHAFRNPSDMAMSALHLNRTAGDRLDRVIIQKIMRDT
jgi:hypothetical protein